MYVADSHPAPAPGRIREYRTTVGGIATRAIEVGGHGPPIVLFHGFCDSADTWRLVLRSLAESERAAVAYDMPCFGYADWGTEGNLLDQQVSFGTAAVERAAQESGEKVIVVGNSLGGWATLRIAERELPIAGIVPVAPAGIELSPWFLRADRIGGISPLIALPAPIPAALIRQVVGRAFVRVAYADPRAVDPWAVRRFCLHNRDRSVFRRRLVAAQGVKSELDRPFNPARVKVPSVVLWGDRDLLCLPRAAEPLAAQLGAKLIMVEGCGHCPQLEAPDSVIEAIDAVASG